MKRVLKMMRSYWYLYLSGFMAVTLFMVLDMYHPIITGNIIDEVVKGGRLDLFKHFALLLLGITLAKVLMGYTKDMLFDYAGVSIGAWMRQDLFDHIQGLSYDFFDEKNTGELMSRIKEDAEKVWFGISFGIMLSFEVLLSAGLGISRMLMLSPKLTLLAAVTMPILAKITLDLNKHIGKTYEEISEQNATLNTIAGENIAGIRLVKAFAREKHEMTKFFENNKEYYELNYKQARLIGKYFPPIEFITNVLPLLVITIGGSFVIGEELTIGELIQFSGFMMMILWPIRMLGWLVDLMAQAGASAKKIEAVYAWQSKIDNSQAKVTEGVIKGDIVFEHVGLVLDDKQVLKDINFHLAPGQTLAIMGATGSGKSLIVKLLSRFYDYTEGRILLDGKELKMYDLSFLRQQVSVVLQDVFLFSDTIEHNIRFGSDQLTTEEELHEIATSAKAHDFISEMENCYETVIGEKGLGLSGGQKQRISIARAFAKKSPIIVFDDSTSALDMQTEKSIQSTIYKMSERSKVIVAHRISAVRQADQILVMEGGEIAERGNHRQLLELKGRYFETWQEQYDIAD